VFSASFPIRLHKLASTVRLSLAFCSLDLIQQRLAPSSIQLYRFDELVVQHPRNLRQHGGDLALVLDVAARHFGMAINMEPYPGNPTFQSEELPVSLSGPIANPTTRQKSSLTLMNSKANRLWCRDTPVYCNLLSSCDRTSEQKLRCRVVGFAIGPDRLTGSSQYYYWRSRLTQHRNNH
jgi:hypothetical protein